MSAPKSAGRGSPEAALLAALRRRGWTVRVATQPRALVPPSVAARYPSLPTALSAFLSSLARCRSADESVWFLGTSDYARKSKGGFRWNEYELMAIETADGDTEGRAKVIAFWDRHLPFMLAVHSDYDYLAVRLEDGVVVHGCAPEWELPIPIAKSFVEFLADFEREASKPVASFPWSVFLRASEARD